MRPEESFISQPIRSLQTMLRVIAEDDASVPTVIPDGVYSRDTITAVSAFQRRFGIPSTGVTDQDTWDSIVEVYEDALIRVDKAAPIEIIFDPGQVFRLGDRSPYLYLMQSMLLYLSLSHPAISTPPHNGMLDSATAESLSGFQVLSGLSPTGDLDRKTWKYLVNLFTLNANLSNRQDELSIS